MLRRMSVPPTHSPAIKFLYMAIVHLRPLLYQKRMGIAQRRVKRLKTEAASGTRSSSVIPRKTRVYGPRTTIAVIRGSRWGIDSLIAQPTAAPASAEPHSLRTYVMGNAV